MVFRDKRFTAPRIAVILLLLAPIGQTAAQKNPPANPDVKFAVCEIYDGFLDYAPEATDEKRRTMRQRLPDYDRLIPGLGRFAPIDARPVFRKMGVEFQPGDLALADEAHGILVVKGRSEMVDLVETIAESVIGVPHSVPRQVWLTILVSRVNHRGAMRLVRSCRLLCSYHSTAWSVSSEIGSEKVQAGAYMGDDGHHCECHIEASFLADSQRIHLDQTVMLRTPELHGRMLASVPAADGNGTIEVRLLAERCLSPSTTEMHNFARRRKTADAEAILKALERPPDDMDKGTAGPRSSGLYSMPWLMEFIRRLQEKDGKDTPQAGLPTARQSIPPPEAGALMPAHKVLKAMGTPVSDEDVAMFSPQSGLLYVECAEPLHEALRSVRPFLGGDFLEIPSAIVSFRTLHATGIGGRISRDQRQMLVRSGHRSHGSDRRGAMEVEASVRSDGATDLNIAFGHVDPRRDGKRDKWDLKWTGTVHSDDRPLLLVEDVRPFCGITRVLVSARPPLTQGAEILLNPEQTAAKIREIQNQLKSRR